MTVWAESSPAKDDRDQPLGPRWRSLTAEAQEAVLPPGRVVVSAPAPLGGGGLGRHLKEILDALERSGQTPECICETSGSRARPAGGLGERARAAALRPVARLSPAWRMWAVSTAFDRGAARRLPPAEHLIAFNGTALAQFRAARRARYESVSLVSANSHFRHVAAQHAEAHRQYPIERPWPAHLMRRNLDEYARAERIYYSSGYIRDSFLEEGFPDDRLAPFPLTPDPRFARGGGGDGGGSSATFDIVYVGTLSVHKGVPLLIDAFRQLPYAELRLVLVGGWSTRGMRRFVEGACAKDARITVRPGDPLPLLRSARLCVHPAYEDGFAYAPAEALACGVPLIVSEDTGMKELLEGPREGLVVPTGNLSVLSETIAAAYRGEIFNG